LEGEACFCDGGVEERWAVLHALEPGADDRGEFVGAAGGQVAQPALEV
jgi:hypothetical protein